MSIEPTRLPSQSSRALRVSAIIPVRNEAACIAQVVSEFRALRRADGTALLAEIIVADNGSTDTSGDIALRAGALVVAVPIAGYGRACWEAAKVSASDAFLYVDGDGACNPQDAFALIGLLETGADLVIGVRHNDSPQAMTPPQRFGNRLSCLLLRLIWGIPTPDLGPYRAIRRDAYEALFMQDRSYGWTVEMQIRAHQIGLAVAECPVGWRARVAGHSKVSGTVRGVVGAGFGILGMIFKLWVAELRRPLHQKQLFHQSANTKGDFYV